MQGGQAGSVIPRLSWRRNERAVPLEKMRSEVALKRPIIEEYANLRISPQENLADQAAKETAAN